MLGHFVMLENQFKKKSQMTNIWYKRSNTITNRVCFFLFFFVKKTWLWCSHLRMNYTTPNNQGFVLSDNRTYVVQERRFYI